MTSIGFAASPRFEARRVVTAAVLALAALALGAVFAAASIRLGKDAAPVFMLGLALVPLIVVATVARPIVGVLAVVAAFPVGSVLLPTPGLRLQTVEVIVAVAMTLVIIHRLARGLGPLRGSGALWWPVVLLGWTILAITAATDLTLALKQVAVLALGIVFAACVVTALDDMDDVRIFLGVLVAVGAYVAISGLSQGVHFQSSLGAETVGGRLRGAFDHPNQLGGFSVICGAVAAGLAFGARTRLGRALATIAVPLILTALLLSLSRGGWIGGGVAFIYLVCVLPQARKALLVVGIPAIVIAALIGSFSPGQTEVSIIGQRAQALRTLSPYDQRHAIYAEAEHEIKTHPLLGVGPGNFPVASARAGSGTETVYADHAHDLWLTWAAEDGIPAAALIACFAMVLGLRARRASRAASARSAQRDRAVMAGVVAALIAVLGQGIFDYLLRNAVLHMTVWGLIGALLVCARAYGADAGERASNG